MGNLLRFLFSKFFLRQIVFLVVGGGILIFLLFQWLRIFTHHNQKIEVPDLSKMTLEQAEVQLNERSLRYKIRDTVSYNPEYPKNSIVRQDPRPGDIVKENRVIYLTLNPSGYHLVKIPDIIFTGDGQTKRNVETTLRSVGFVIGNHPTYIPDPAKDIVRGLKHKGKKLKKGDKLPKKSVIDLILGDGKG